VRLVNIALVVVAWYSLLFQMPAAKDWSNAATITSRSSELPFRLSSGYLIEVEGRIGTQSHLRFLIDTGATISIVDSRIASQLKLQRRPAESATFDRKLVWELASVPEVEVGQIEADNVQMLVGRLAEYSEFARKTDAIIGMDLLKLSNFSIDYEAKKIIFHSRPQHYAPPSGEPLLECVILELHVQGHLVRLIVDTGFPSLLLYEERLLKRVPLLRTTGHLSGVSIGGRLQGKQVVLPDVEFGERNGEVSVLLAKAPPSEMLPGIDGIVGLAPLKARRVHFDFGGKRLTWE
jgi:predicted aspartyl protease